MRPTDTPIDTNAPRASRDSSGKIKYLNELNKGNWFVSTPYAYMHVNTPGDYLYMGVRWERVLGRETRGLLIGLNAVEDADFAKSLGLTAEQLDRLRKIDVTLRSNSLSRGLDTVENQELMRQVWAEFQAAPDADKKAAEEKVLAALNQLVPKVVEGMLPEYVRTSDEIREILTPEQVKQVIVLDEPPRRTREG